MRTEFSINSIHKERMILFFNCSNLRRRLPFSGEIIQFWTTNQQQPKWTFAQRNRDFKGSWRQSKENRQEQDSFTARDRYSEAPYTFTSRIYFFVSPIRVSLSSLSVSRIIQTENFVRVEIFLELGKRLLKNCRVQSRSRGNRTIQYTHRGFVFQN